MRIIGRWRLFGVLFLCGILLLQFQNCAQVSNLAAEVPLSSVQPDARISDDWRSDPIVFPSAAVEVAEHLEITHFYGLCLRQAQTTPLRWQLKEEGQIILAGDSSCFHGNFQVDLNDLQNLSCGTTHTLSIEDVTTGATASMTLTRRCPASHIQEENDGCIRERVLQQNGSPSCESVCYDQGIVAKKTPLPLDQCPASGS